MSVHLLSGFVLALLLAIVDVSIGRATSWATGVPALDVIKAMASLAAMTLPCGLGFGASMSLLALWLRPLAWAQRTRLVIAQPRTWFDNDPPLFATLLAVLSVAAPLFAVLWRAAFHFATAYHNPELGSLAMAGASVVAFVIALVIVSALQPPLVAFGARLGRVASVGSVVLLALGFATLVIVSLWQQRSDLFAVLDVRVLSELAGAAISYPLLLVLIDRLRMRPRRKAVAALSAVLVAAVAISLCANLYSQRQRVRHLVERETTLGVPLLHAYASLTDTDHDGHSFVFGGGDCNDGDPRVHPGAREIAGDGLDSNCMGGDVDPDVSDLGDGAYAPAPSTLGRPNLLVITVDALRPDRLGAYNTKQKSRKVSPNLDAFAKEAARFDAAMSPSSRSIRSIPAMWIGAYPSQIAFGPEHLWPTLLSQNVTAPELLAQHGYHTVAIIGTNYFSNMPDFFQGFGHVVAARTYKPSRAEAVTSALGVLDKLQRREYRAKPWLMWVHLFNVHEPYLHDLKPSKHGSERIDAYDTEVTFADEQIGRLLTSLKDRGLQDNTVVVIASDHGEAFMEHGTIGHSYTLYDEELRSTLLVRVPGQASRVVTQPVSLIDLAPTLLNLAGVPMQRPTPARSWLAPIQGQSSTAGRALYAELMPDGSLPYDEKAVMLDGWKLMWRLRDGSLQLFDLRNDPGERNDLADTERTRARQLLTRLRSWVAQTNLRPNVRNVALEQHRLKEFPREMTARVDADYGPFTLVGYDVKSRALRIGDKLMLDLYFDVRERMREDYYFEVTFTGPPGVSMPRYLQAAHYPLNGAYRTFEWQAGERLQDPIQITIPAIATGATGVTIDMRMRIVRRGPSRVILQTPKAVTGWLPLGQIQIRK